MLQQIRDRASGLLATIVLGILALSFALWGIGDYITPNAETTIALVNDQEIDVNELNLLANARNTSNRQQRRELVERMIDQAVNQQAYQSSGMSISPSQVANEIASTLQFQINGQFSADAYQNFLTSARLTPTGYEALIRESLLERQFRSAINDSSIALPSEVAVVKRLQDQQRSYRAVRVSRTQFDQDIDVSDDDVQAYYEANSDQFKSPQRVSVDFLEITTADFDSDIAVDEVILRAEYEDKKARFLVGEQRLVSHILFELPAGADADAESAVLAEANMIAEQARQDDADFAALAITHSDDVGSGKEGGDLGWIADDGQMVRPFADAVFGLESGEISDPVKTRFGFHVIALKDVQEERGKTFDEVRDQLANDYRELKAEELMLERETEIADMVLESSDNFGVAAELYNLSVKTTVPFSRDGNLNLGDDMTLDTTLMQNPVVVEQAFSDDVLSNGLNSAPIPIDNNRSVVLRINESYPEAIEPLDTVRTQIIDQLTRERQLAQAEEALDSLKGRLESGEDFEALAGELNAELISVENGPRFGGAADPALNSRVFELPKPINDATGYHRVSITSDDMALVGLDSVSYPQPVTDTSDGVANLGQEMQIRNAYAISELSAYFNALRSEAKVVVFDDRIQ